MPVRSLFYRNTLVVAFALPLTIALAACASRGGEQSIRESWDPGAIPEIRGVAAEELQVAISARLAEDAPSGVTPSHWQRTAGLYEAYEHRPLFLERRGVGARAAALLSAIAGADEDALDRERYALPGLDEALRRARGGDVDAATLAEADVLLAATYLTLGDDLLTGQVDPRAVNRDWRIDPRVMNVDSILTRTLRFEPLDVAIAGIRPGASSYNALRGELEHYRQLVARGGWEALADDGTLHPRDTTAVARLTALRDRLAAEDYVAADLAITPLEGDSTRAVYDEQLAGAVAEFQRRHAIVVDSIIGGETVTSMNVTAEYRLGQIAANLERLRWLPRDLGERYIYVNVPAFRLDAYESGESVLSMRVIVGADYRSQATPAFADSMSYLEFAPYWNVPESIAQEEIWPKANADPDYLSRNRYEVVNENGTTRIRQLPGRSNALGLVKFMFPNEFDIYLHHTPQEELFEEDVRAFSHGCIRVEKPEELAEYVLARQGNWTIPAIREAMNGENRRVDLERKIPVYIVYLTAFVQDGVLHFGNDVYDRDASLVQAMANAAVPTEESERRVVELRRHSSGSFMGRLLSRLGIG